jgi:hypothetical protein
MGESDGMGVVGLSPTLGDTVGDEVGTSAIGDLVGRELGVDMKVLLGAF